jgi:peptide/nickel transport system substrate-binding protein
MEEVHMRNFRCKHLFKSLQHVNVFVLVLTAAILIWQNQILAADDEWKCPKIGGIIKHQDMNWAHIDSGARATPDWVVKYIYDGLIDVTWDLKYRPGLAKEMPKKVSDTIFEFELRQGVKFHDGTEFNADAVKFAMDRLIAGGDQLTAPSQHTGVWRKNLEKLEVLGPYKIRMQLKRPWPDLMWNLASAFFIPSPTAVKKYGKEFGTKGIIGTGPFVLKMFKPKERLEVVRNPDYFRPNEPCVDEIHAIQISSGSVRLLSLRRGELTNLFTFPESQMPLIENDPNIKIYEGEASTLTVLTVNTSLDKLRDKKVRRALQYSVDGQEIIDRVYRGRGAMVTGLFPPWHPAYREATKDELALIRQDVEQARQLLKEAGYGPGNPLKLDLQTFAAPAHVERSVVLQNQFKSVGIEVSVRNLPAGTVLENLFAGKYDLVLYQYTGGPTVGTYTWDLYAGDSTANPTFYNKENGYENPTVDKVMNEVIGKMEVADAAELAASIQKQVFEDAPYIFLNWRNHREAWNPKLIKNHHVSFLKNRQDWRRVWIDK